MINADKFEQVFGIYATELWAKPEKDFLEWLNSEAQEVQDISIPSAEPERLTDDDFETIRIHLNAYKEKLCNQQRWEEAKEYQRIIDRFMAFASAERTGERELLKDGTLMLSTDLDITDVRRIILQKKGTHFCSVFYLE